MVAQNQQIIDLTRKLAASCREGVYFEWEMGRLRAAVGEEEAHHGSFCMRADRFKREVEDLKVHGEIANNDSARGVEDLCELEKIRRDDQGAGSLLQFASGSSDQLLDPTAQGFRDLRDAVL